MGNGYYKIDEHVFKNMSAEDRSWMTYKTLNDHMADDEKCKKKNAALAAASGFVGGGLVWVASLFSSKG